MRIVKIGPRGHTNGITIPAEYLRQLGLVRGDHLVLEIEGGVLRLERLNHHTVSTRSRSKSHMELPRE